VWGLVSCCVTQQGVLSMPLPSPRRTRTAFLPSVLSLSPAGLSIPLRSHCCCEHAMFMFICFISFNIFHVYVVHCACGTAQVPAGLCAAHCPGQGPDLGLRIVCCCGLAHKAL